MSAHVVSIRDALYEVPGPKTRRRMVVGTAVAALFVASLIAWVVYQFYVTGQLDEKYWSFFLKASTWAFIGEGLVGTLKSALVAGVISLALGLLFMLGRISSIKALRAVCTCFIDFFRGVPSLLLIYFFFLVIPKYGLNLPSFWMITLPVALSASGVLAEVFRAGVNAVPRGQTEAALALGMSRAKILGKIVLPQAIRYVIPSLVAQLVIVVKDTTFAYVVSYPDIMQNAKVLISNYDALVSVYLVVAVIYIVINYLINKLSLVIARKMDVKIIK